MARPRKKARDLTDAEALAKLFPKRVLKEALEEARKADEKATKRNSK